MDVLHGKLDAQAWMLAEETVKVMAALHDDGGVARFVGGAVRDALCNRAVYDIDIATPLTPDAVIDRLDRHGIAHAPTGLKHGTVTAIVNGHPFEITTLREDVQSHGRHADVRYTANWAADAARRDFTINAMYATQNGDVYDPFGGIADLRDGRVVFVGDPAARIGEDILRILRFFRFYAHYGRGAPDAAALAACRAQAQKIPLLSAERVRDETLKTLAAGRVAAVWSLMLESGIAAYFLPDATDVPALERLLVLEKKLDEGEAAPLMRLAALLDVSEEGLAPVCRHLRLSGRQTAVLHGLLFPPLPVTTGMAAQDIRRAVYRMGADITRGALLLHAAKTGQDRGLEDLYRAATVFRPPPFPLRGEDAMALGLQGQDIGHALRRVETWWMSMDFQPGRTACLEKLSAGV